MFLSLTQPSMPGMREMLHQQVGIEGRCFMQDHSFTPSDYGQDKKNPARLNQEALR